MHIPYTKLSTFLSAHLILDPRSISDLCIVLNISIEQRVCLKFKNYTNNFRKSSEKKSNTILFNKYYAHIFPATSHFLEQGMR